MRATCFPIGTNAQAVLGPGDVGALLQADASNTQDLYLGGEYVTADATGTGGARLGAGVSLPVELAAGDILYAISPSGVQLLRVVQGSRT